MEMNKAKDIVIKAGKELVARGLIARTWGNVSQRLNDTTMLITPSGKGYLSLTRGDIVPVDIATLEYQSAVKPSSEKAVHACCYLQRGAKFVIHTHQLYASAVSACGINGFKADEKKFPLLGGYVPLAKYGLPGTKKLSRGVEKSLVQTNGHAVIMKHHGALCFGENFEEAFETAKQLEAACEAYIESIYQKVSHERYTDSATMAEYVLRKNGCKCDALKARGVELNGRQKNVLINTSLEVEAMSYMKKPLRPLVDDFAQIVGVKMRVRRASENRIGQDTTRSGAEFVRGDGAVCWGPTTDDAKAVSMIVKKNCKAYIFASLHGEVKPINWLESRLMRMVYQKKYSKQIDG